MENSLWLCRGGLPGYDGRDNGGRYSAWAFSSWSFRPMRSRPRHSESFLRAGNETTRDEGHPSRAALDLQTSTEHMPDARSVGRAITEATASSGTPSLTGPSRRHVLAEQPQLVERKRQAGVIVELRMHAAKTMRHHQERDRVIIRLLEDRADLVEGRNPSGFVICQPEATRQHGPGGRACHLYRTE